MKFTVLGGSGFVGRHCVDYLQREGHDVEAPVRDDDSIFRRPLGCVLYCIGLTSDFRSRPFATVRAHVSLLADVLERGSFESFLYLSSTRVYAGSPRGSEDAPLSLDVADASALYNASKLAGESLCRSAGREHVRVARLSNVVGFNPGSTDFVQSITRDALAGRIVLQSDPESSKDYILVEDVASLLVRIAVAGSQWLYNVASGTSITHRALAARIAASTGCEIATSKGGARVRFPDIDIRRARDEFGFAPRPVLAGIPALVESYRAISSAK